MAAQRDTAFSLNLAPKSAGPDPVKDGSDKSFAADVIEASKTQPVIVDFWAPWCGPCKTLGPPLEKHVRAAKGKVQLVKINIDDNPAIAGQLGVRSIPAVYAFDKGRPVDGFMGAQPESQIKLFVERLAKNAPEDGGVEELLALAEESLALGDLGGAAQAYVGVLQVNPENVKAIAGLARCYLAGGDPERARDTLAMAAPDKAGAPELSSVRAALDLATQAGPAGGDARALTRRLESEPDDHEARFALANALAGQGRLEEAADHLLTIIAKERGWNEDAARLQLLKIFEAAGPASDVAKSGRRRLSAILFS